MTLLHRPAAPSSTPRPAQVGRSRPGPADPAGLATRISRGAVLLSIAAALVVPAWLLAHQTWVLAAGFLLGLPHGALDHLLPFRHRWLRSGPWTLLGVLVAYVALAAAAYAGLRWAGPLVLPLLLAVSVLHFGSGDLASDERSSASRWPQSRASRLLAAAGRGGPVVAGPLLAWSVQTGSALAAVGLGSAPSRTTDTVVGVVLLGAGAAYALLAARRGRSIDAAEVALLVGLFVLVPPLAAFGVYFGAWHGLRHTARLLADDPRNAPDLAADRIGGPLRRFLADAAVPTVLAGTTVAVLVRLAAGRAALAAPVFDVLLALTVPHVVVVALWDARRRTGRTLPVLPSLAD